MDFREIPFFLSVVEDWCTGPGVGVLISNTPLVEYCPGIPAAVGKSLALAVDDDSAEIMSAILDVVGDCTVVEAVKKYSLQTQENTTPHIQKITTSNVHDLSLVNSNTRSF